MQYLDAFAVMFSVIFGAGLALLLLSGVAFVGLLMFNRRFRRG